MHIRVILFTYIWFLYCLFKMFRFHVCTDGHTVLTRYESYVISFLCEITFIDQSCEYERYYLYGEIPTVILHICVPLFFFFVLSMSFFLFRILLYNVVLHIIRTQLDNEVVEWTSYTEDTGNATPPVCHCDHNKINAAAVTKYILYPYLFFVTMSLIDISFTCRLLFVCSNCDLFFFIYFVLFLLKCE
jgi:hypothetical protein